MLVKADLNNSSVKSLEELDEMGRIKDYKRIDHEKKSLQWSQAKNPTNKIAQRAFKELNAVREKRNLKQ